MSHDLDLSDVINRLDRLEQNFNKKLNDFKQDIDKKLKEFEDRFNRIDTTLAVVNAKYDLLSHAFSNMHQEAAYDWGEEAISPTGINSTKRIFGRGPYY